MEKIFQNLRVRLKLNTRSAMKIKLFVAREIQYFELGNFSFNSYVYYLTRGFIASTRAFNLLTRASNLPTHAFSLPTRAFNLTTRAFSVLTRECALVTRIFELVTRHFELVTREFEFVTRGFELVTRGFELVARGFELATCGFELVTRVLLFHDYTLMTLCFTLEKPFFNFSCSEGLYGPGYYFSRKTNVCRVFL